MKYVLIFLGKTKAFNFHMWQLKDNDMKRKMWKGFNMELLKFHPKGQPLMQPKTNPLNQLQCTILTRIKNCYVEFFERIFLMCLKIWKIIYNYCFCCFKKRLYFLGDGGIFLLMSPRALKSILPHFSSFFLKKCFSKSP